MKRAAILGIVLAVIVLLVLGGGLFAGYKITNGDYNLKNVNVGGIDVSDLTRSETEAKLIAEGWNERISKPLTVTLPGGQTFSVDPVKAGFAVPTEQAAELAHGYGRDNGLLGNLVTYVRQLAMTADVNQLAASPDADYINSCIDSGLTALQQYMGSTEYEVDYHTGVMTMKKGWNQLAFDKSDMRAVIAEALTQGKTEVEYTKLARELTAPDFDAISASLDSDPHDAEYSEDGTFEVIDECLGCKMDPNKALSIWTETRPGDVVEIPMDVTRPEITGDMLRDRLFHDLLGATTTKFPASGPERRNNLQLAISKLDGHIIYPGETFSYNETVGVRTEEAGFKAAPAYVNGDTKDEIGGGVCQVASTLYCSSLFAFIETVERECHYFRPSYMQMGTDATVTIPSEGRAIDFKFRNNKSYPVMIKGYFDNENSTLTMEIWGTLEDGDYMPVEFDNSYGWEFDYDRTIDPAYDGREGYIIKLDHETYTFSDDVGVGFRTLTHRIVKNAAGETLEDVIINPKIPAGYAMDTYYSHE